MGYWVLHEFISCGACLGDSEDPTQESLAATGVIARCRGPPAQEHSRGTTPQQFETTGIHRRGGVDYGRRRLRKEAMEVMKHTTGVVIFSVCALSVWVLVFVVLPWMWRVYCDARKPVEPAETWHFKSEEFEDDYPGNDVNPYSEK